MTDGSPGPSSPVTIGAPGTYSWYTSYSGDRSNNQASAACIGTQTVEKANQAPLSITSTSGKATVPLPLTTSGGSGTGAASLRRRRRHRLGLCGHLGRSRARRAPGPAWSPPPKPATSTTTRSRRTRPRSPGPGQPGAAQCHFDLGHGHGAPHLDHQRGLGHRGRQLRRRRRYRLGLCGQLGRAQLGQCRDLPGHRHRSRRPQLRPTSSTQTTVTLALASQAPLSVTSTSGTATVPLTLTTSGGSGTGAVSYAVADGTASGCAVSSGALSSASAGTCLVTATEAGDANYDATSSPQTTVTLALASQAISFSAPASGTVGTGATLSATGGASGNPVVFSIDATSGTGVCVVSGTDGTTVSYTTVGSCVIDANQAGSASYLSAPMVTRAIVVVAAPAPSRASQTISFASLPKRAHARSAVTVRASASSGLVVSFSTTTPRVCTALPVRGGAAVVLHGPGICTVMASQAGNAHYAPAPPVSGSFTVSKAVQTIRFVAIPHRALAGSTIIVRASASSGLKVGFTGATPSVCTLVQTRGGARVTLLRAGKCTVVAYQAGNSTFRAASPVNESLTVWARPQHLGTGGSSAGATHVPWHE